MRVLITGATGFFGAHIVRAVRDRGMQPVAGARTVSDPWRLVALAPGVEIVAFDMIDSMERMAALFKQARIDGIIHAAGYGVDYRQSDFEMGLRTNVLGGERLVRAAKRGGCRLIVHVGTSMEFGPHDAAVNERTPLEPRGSYGVTKACASIAMRDAAISEGIDLAIARPWGLYGPLEGLHKFIPVVMEAGRRGRRVDLSPGEQLRDYVYVVDAAKGVVDLFCRPDFPSGESFNFGSGKTITLRQLGEAALQAVGGDPNLLNWGGKAYRSDEVMRMMSDQSKTHAVLGWQAKTNLMDGMQQTAAVPYCGPPEQ